MNDLRIQRARQVEASFVEAARAGLSGDDNKANEIIDLLEEEGVSDVCLRYAWAIRRLRGKPDEHSI